MAPTILVPLDGSPTAEAVLPTAQRLAAAFDADLHLLTTMWSDPTGEEQVYLDGLVPRLDVPADRSVTTEVADHEYPGPGIVRVATERGDTVVCLRTHGRSGLREAIFGSVAENVLRLWDGPLVLVGPAAADDDAGATGAAAAPATDGGTGPVVVCFDGSPTSASVEPTAVRFAATLGAPVVLVGVEQLDPIMFGAEEASTLREQLDRMADRLRAEGLSVTVEHLDGGDPGLVVPDLARSVGAQLLAVASHGRSGFARTLLGSVAVRIVRHSPVPVVVVRVPEPEG